MINSSVRTQDVASQQAGSVTVTETVATIPTNRIAVNTISFTFSANNILIFSYSHFHLFLQMPVHHLPISPTYFADRFCPFLLQFFLFDCMY